ncbi:hypothetical protein [Pseudomonas sp. Gutcm_11s]|uniref:hypothetical protein n=1 Tax=Pseudomonas sp. Gutcm_11s TaxID=3026088 RepID=UPI00236173E9|nr:hypothetical protein [Pseudomonas sp. Gutcm_11s]MDD0842759.1 hypothetical protein [Pseudomonas sp. Gutcm_11s]
MMGRRGLAAGLALLLVMAGGYAWLKAPYANEPARAVARDFLQLLQADRFEQAHALTLGADGLTGRNASELREMARRQLCTREALALVWLHPPQSNGNRLRRWLRNQELEVPSINVRFEGACLISVELRRDGQGLWRVFNFQSTAG